MAIDRKINTNKKQFDLKTHIRDGKGNIKEAKPYRLTIVNGVKEFERPPGSGFIYTEGGDLIRSPKSIEDQVSSKPKSEFTNDELLKQLEALQAQVARSNESLTKENPEVLDSAPANGQVDLSEELSIMERSGAIKEAAELKAAKFNKPSYLK